MKRQLFRCVCVAVVLQCVLWMGRTWLSRVLFCQKSPMVYQKSPTVSQKSPVVNQKRPVLNALAFTAPSGFTPSAACGSASVLLFCHGVCACVRVCVRVYTEGVGGVVNGRM